MIGSLRQNCGRFQSPEDVLNDVRPLADDANEIDSHRLSEQRHVGGRNVFRTEAGPAGDGAQTGMRILEVLETG